MSRHNKLNTLTFFLSIFSSSALYAEKVAGIIIDDLGHNIQYGREIINFPDNLTFAILPKTTYAKTLARLATKNHKEVMLHLPMQSVEHHQHSPGTLDLHMTKTEFIDQLHLNLNSVPYIRGVNNHMGSLLTRHPGHMTWLMNELDRHGGLYFVDSKTTSKSIADKIAVEYDIPHLSRDFFIDPEFNEQVMQQQFDRFIAKIKQRGYALAIAHPHPVTIAFLKKNLHRLKQQGITLLPVSKLIKRVKKINRRQDNTHVACTRTTCSGL